LTPIFLREQQGRIVNIGFISGFISGPGMSSYAASKFAVRAMTDALRLELAQFDMFVSYIAPGAIESDIWTKAVAYKQERRAEIAPELLQTYH
jgi:short-subunit dehydrogenase